MPYTVTEYTEEEGKGSTGRRTVAVCPERQDAEIIAAEYREAAGAGPINLQTDGIHWRYVIEEDGRVGALLDE